MIDDWVVRTGCALTASGLTGIRADRRDFGATPS